MKAILEFNLPEEYTDLKHAVNGDSWSCVVWKLDEELRSMAKHQEKETISIDECRDLIRNIVSDYGLNIMDIYE